MATLVALALNALAFSGSATAGRRASALGRSATGSSRIVAIAAEPGRRELLATGSAALAVSLLASPSPASAGLFGGSAKKSAWTQVDIPVDSILFDVEFDTNQPEHGWIVGNKGTCRALACAAGHRARRRRWRWSLWAPRAPPARAPETPA